MWKLKNKTILELSFIWTLLFIGVSVLLTIIACSTLITMVYHIFFIPVYMFISYPIVFLFSYLNKKTNTKNWLSVVFFLLIVMIISFYLQDFRSAFGIFKYSKYSFSFDRLIGSGCREMFNFLSWVISSLLIMRNVIHFGKNK